MALFTITTSEKTNLPPSQVGDGSAATGYGVTYVFTVADFTTETSPPYADPEGDAAAQLKITSSNAELAALTGELRHNGTPITTTGYIISFADIAAGLFTFVPDGGTTSSYNDVFTFEIADSGSGTFVG